MFPLYEVPGLAGVMSEVVVGPVLYGAWPTSYNFQGLILFPIQGHVCCPSCVVCVKEAVDMLCGGGVLCCSYGNAPGLKHAGRVLVV